MRHARTVDACEKRIAALEEALAFYADPGTYFAWAFLADPPCGEFGDDFSETELGHKPGKLAREVLYALGPAPTDNAGERKL